VAITLPAPAQQPTTKERHEFGPGLLPELSIKLYKNPLAALREAISNSFDAMSPYETRITPKIVIYTNVLPNGDITIEDWGTGIENYQDFKTISPGRKQVKDQISSYDKVNEKIIGKKGMGKLSFLNLSNEQSRVLQQQRTPWNAYCNDNGGIYCDIYEQPSSFTSSWLKSYNKKSKANLRSSAYRHGE